MKKKCNVCLELLSLDSFHKDKSKEDGYSYLCRGCQKIKAAKHYTNNRAKIRFKANEYSRKNPIKKALNTKKWVEKNPERRRSILEKYTLKHKKEIKSRQIFNNSLRYKSCLLKYVLFVVIQTQKHTTVIILKHLK